MVTIPAPLRRVLVALVSGWACLAASQSAPADEPARVPPPAPPAIEFPNWKLEAETETDREMLVTLPSAVPSGIPENDRFNLRVFLPAVRTRPTPIVLVIHYWGATDLRAERQMAAELNQVGISAALIELPYHLSRTPPGSRSGQLAIQPDPVRLRRTMEQSLADVRRSIDFLVARPEFDATRVGIVGTSLGAIVTSLAAAVDERVGAAAFLVGGIDLAGVVWESSLLVLARDELRRNGWTQERLRRELAPVEPGEYLPAKHALKSFVIGAQYDTVVPAAFTRRLVERLESPAVLWIQTGHYGGVFVQRRLQREVSRFFQTSFAGREYVAPERLVAPTIRIGAKLDSTLGAEVAVGLDLLKFDRRGNTFATLLLTPRGPQIFLGRKLDAGFSFGATGSLRGVGVGILWSSVL